MKIIKMLKINLIVASIIASPFTLISTIKMICEKSVNKEQIFQVLHLIFAIFILINIISLPIYIVKILLAAKKTINEQYIDSKESIYTRELPEEYNSVIAGEILDFKSKFKDEYVAGVIELISKGYIIEEDKLIINNEKSTDNLLKNEKYILETCTKINEETYFEISNEFFTKIREDMLDLGLYKKSNLFGKLKDYLKKYENSRVLGLLVFMTFIMLDFLNIFKFNSIVFAIIIAYITIIIILRKNKLTKKGEIEKEKISKLKLFFDRETNFKEKTKEERKIWGRYSAFAVALGTNEKIKEEVYTKYLKNQN